jgi:hypothetical protein
LVFIAVCFQPICNFLKFPEDCKLPNADVTCGRFCGNQICGSRSIPRRNHSRQRNRRRSRNRIRSHNRRRSQNGNRKAKLEKEHFIALH